eukprot:g4139.t1
MRVSNVVGDTLTCGTEEIGAKEESPWRMNEESEEIITCLHGNGLICIGNESFDLKENEPFHIKKGLRHKIKNTSTCKSLLLQWTICSENEMWRSRAQQAEEELQLTKALLLLKNVEVEVNLSSSYKNKVCSNNCKTEYVYLGGEGRLLQELMSVRDRVKLLQHWCSELRREMKNLAESIPKSQALAAKAIDVRLRSEILKRKQVEARLKKLQLLVG